MKPTLSLQIGHQLTMTPQLQQAIKLLQLSALDLQTEINAMVEANPLLEVIEPEQSETYDSESSLDANYQPAKPTSSSESADILLQKSDELSLKAHLEFQWQFAPLDENIYILGETLIDSINEDGYLETTLEEACASVGTSTTLEDAHFALAEIQKLDPTGVGARNLQECLLIQLKALPDSTPWRQKAIDLVKFYLSLLGKRDYETLRRRLNVSVEDAKSIVHLIQTLNPRPGSIIGDSAPKYIVPDVFIVKHQDKWVVQLNPSNVPKLKINSYYANMAKVSHSERDQQFLRSNLQEARWLLKSLVTRNETLLKVTQCILDKQHAFLEHGAIAMRPMTLQDVASEIEMHESTVSRITTQKYMHTARGIYELKYFFSSHIDTEKGSGCSSTAIRALIKKFIEQEDRAKPLSDNQLTLLLNEQGIKIARRTVAKYREAMAILPSNERKQIL